jgi:large subunit ribosomal protein L15
MPLFRRLPKRGFSNYRFIHRYEIINVSQLDRFEDGAVIDVKSLFSAGLVDSASSIVKVLGDGELTKKLDVSVQKFSKAAQDKILSCGGVARVIA